MATKTEDYRVDLDIYNGPLDLLLYLIRRDEIDVYDIPIAEITGQFLGHMEIIKALDLASVGDFIVMAATLMEIKSRMLLPVEEELDEDEDEEDPRLELVRQLIEYKRFKDAASTLADWKSVQDRRAARPGELGAFEREPGPEELGEEVDVWQLVEAFAQLMRQTGAGLAGTVVYDDTPIAEHMQAILDLLGRRTLVAFRDLFADVRSKGTMISYFLALLELTKQHKVRFEQPRDHGEIIIAIRIAGSEGQGKAARPFALVPPVGGRLSQAHCLKLRRPMVQPAYQLRAMRQMRTVPARWRAYQGCVRARVTGPSLRHPLWTPSSAAAYRRPPAADGAAAPQQTAYDDLGEVEAIQVRDVTEGVPAGFTPRPGVGPSRLPLHRRPGWGAGRHAFIAGRRSLGYTPQRPVRPGPLALPLAVAPEPAAPVEGPTDSELPLAQLDGPEEVAIRIEQAELESVPEAAQVMSRGPAMAAAVPLRVAADPPPLRSEQVADPPSVGPGLDETALPPGVRARGADVGAWLPTAPPASDEQEQPGVGALDKRTQERRVRPVWPPGQVRVHRPGGRGLWRSFSRGWRRVHRPKRPRRRLLLSPFRGKPAPGVALPRPAASPACEPFPEHGGHWLVRLLTGVWRWMAAVARKLWLRAFGR